MLGPGMCWMGLSPNGVASLVGRCSPDLMDASSTEERSGHFRTVSEFDGVALPQFLDRGFRSLYRSSGGGWATMRNFRQCQGHFEPPMFLSRRRARQGALRSRH